MIIENPAALQFLLTEEIYFSKNDIDNFEAVAPEVVTVEAPPVENPPVQPVVIQTPVVEFQYLGQNKKGFLIVCHYADNEHMDDKHLEALKSALQRKELGLDDIAILNLGRHAEADINLIQQYFKPQRLLLLGDHCRLTGWEILALNQLTDLQSIKALYTYSFGEMMGDRDKTKAFWEQMKLL
jgi:hypothetical protein